MIGLNSTRVCALRSNTKLNLIRRGGHVAATVRSEFLACAIRDWLETREVPIAGVALLLETEHIESFHDPAGARRDECLGRGAASQAAPSRFIASRVPNFRFENILATGVIWNYS